MSAEKLLQLQTELSRYLKVMKQATEVILNEGVTVFPIFIAHQVEMELGIPIVNHHESGELWSIHASSLEEFVARNIIANDHIDDFKANYKNPEEYLCVFVISELGALFIYIPQTDKYRFTDN